MAGTRSGTISTSRPAAAAERLEFAAKTEDFSALFTHLDALEEALQHLVSVVDTLEGL